MIVLGDVNDGQHSNTLNILTGQPRYLVGDSAGGADTGLYTAQTLQEYRDTRDVYYTHVLQDLRESLDHVLVSEQFYDNSRKRRWLFDGLVINNDHLNTEDHKANGYRRPRHRPGPLQVAAGLSRRTPGCAVGSRLGVGPGRPARRAGRGSVVRTGITVVWMADPHTYAEAVQDAGLGRPRGAARVAGVAGRVHPRGRADQHRLLRGPARRPAGDPRRHPAVRRTGRRRAGGVREALLPDFMAHLFREVYVAWAHRLGRAGTTGGRRSGALSALNRADQIRQGRPDNQLP